MSPARQAAAMMSAAPGSRFTRGDGSDSRTSMPGTSVSFSPVMVM